MASNRAHKYLHHVLLLYLQLLFICPLAKYTSVAKLDINHAVTVP